MHGNNQNRQKREKDVETQVAAMQDNTISSEEVPSMESNKSVIASCDSETEVINASQSNSDDEQKFGYVIDCVRLNVRKHPDPNADVVTTLAAKSNVMVDLKESTEDFYKVCNAAGIDGFCMKRYIELCR